VPSIGGYITGNNIIIDGNQFWNISGQCVEHWSQIAGTTPDNNIFRNNSFHDCGARGLLVSSGTGTQVYNNIIYRVGTDPQFSGDSLKVGGYGFATHDVQAYNNTIYGNQHNCITVGVSAGDTTGTILRNNICYKNNPDSISPNGNSVTQDHNLLGTDPLFVNAAGADFHLQANSPAIDAGVAIPGLSFNGTAPDLGAFETGVGGQLPAPINLRLVGN